MIQNPNKNVSKISDIILSIATIILAIATIVLTVITYVHMKEAKNMRENSTRMLEETKKFSDLTIEQFKIKSYPQFLIELKDISFMKNRRIQEFSVFNGGEITAFNVSILNLNVYEKSKTSLYFAHSEDTSYVNLELKSDFVKASRPMPAGVKEALLYEMDLPRDTSFKLIERTKFEEFKNSGNLKFKLIFIRFKIPLETIYRYQVFAYYLKNNKHWNMLSAEDKKDLIEFYFKVKRNKVTENFLSDFMEK